MVESNEIYIQYYIIKKRVKVAIKRQWWSFLSKLFVKSIFAICPATWRGPKYASGIFIAS